MSGYEIVRADPAGDRERILGVWGRNLAAHDPNEHVVRYDWLCRCPVQPPRFWLALKDGQPVGTAGLGIRQVSFDGRPVYAGIAGDFAVDARHRMIQPALSLQKAVTGSLDEGLGLVYGLPNPNAMKIFERQGYKKLGSLTRYVKVLRVGKFLKSAPGWKKKLSPLAPVVDLGLKLRSADTWRRPGGGRVPETVTSFDSRFDDLWARVAPSAGAIGVRTADFLRWRYAECPLQRYQTLALAEPAGGRLLGYITWYLLDDGQARVADWVADPAAASAKEELLAGLVRRAREDGAASVSCEYFGGDGLGGILETFGFVKRDCVAQLAVYSRPAEGNGASPSLADRCAAWYFLRGDENVNTL